jgi:XTP/dITP diphosphohydrolase
MFTLLAGTTNKHKLLEISELMSNIRLKLISLSEYSGYPEVIEDGLTFKENAYKKARAYYDHFKQPVFADDSGLVVPALNNEPGVFSARYAGANATYADNNKLLINKIQSVPVEQRIARFVCTISYIDHNNSEFFTGITEGIIITELTGTEGFGYDPLFFIPSLNKTYAQLSMQEKNKLSHRGKAILELKNYLIARKLVLTS